MANSYRDALERIRRYVEVRDKLMPLRGLDSIIHGIHGGTEYEAQITLDDLRAIVNGSEPESGESRWPSHESLAFALQALDCSMGLLKERGYQDDSSTLNNLSIARGWLRECVDAARGDATSGGVKNG